MKFTSTTRHFLLAIAATATFVVILWAVYDVAKAVRELTRTESIATLTDTRQIYVDLAKQVMVVGFDLSSQPSPNQSEIGKLRTWLAEQKKKSGTSGKQIASYPIPVMIEIRPLLDEVESTLNACAASRTSCRALFSLASEANSRAAGIDQYLSLSGKWKQSYIKLLVVSLVVLAVLAGWLGLLLYRLLAAPLRRQLLQTAATIERQQKLAHFGELAAGLAHEIRNPLTAINTRLYTLRRSIPAGTAEAEDAVVIGSELHHLDRIVKDFLTLARPSEPHLATVTARPIFDAVFDLLGGELKKQSITLKIENTVETPFQSDPQQIKQVLINLVQNAADAIGQDGTITLSARFAVQKLSGQSVEVVILEVTDTGPGIPVDVQDRLFDPFFSTKPTGSGLGLPISARIIAQHGGVIELQSQLGRGTIFSIILPVQRYSDET